MIILLEEGKYWSRVGRHACDKPVEVSDEALIPVCAYALVF